jgi:transposase
MIALYRAISVVLCYCSHMGNPAGVRRDFAELEQRRMLAAKLLRKGLRQAEVARQVRVPRQTVSRWARELDEKGLRGLKRAERAGRKRRLSAEHLRRIERQLQRGPKARGYATELWTVSWVGRLIEEECGIHFHIGHIWRLLRRMGWGWQGPNGWARQSNEVPHCRVDAEKVARDGNKPERRGVPLPSLGGSGM